MDGHNSAACVLGIAMEALGTSYDMPASRMTPRLTTLPTVAHAAAASREAGGRTRAGVVKWLTNAPVRGCAEHARRPHLELSRPVFPPIIRHGGGRLAPLRSCQQVLSCAAKFWSMLETTLDKHGGCKRRTKASLSLSRRLLQCRRPHPQPALTFHRPMILARALVVPTSVRPVNKGLCVFSRVGASCVGRPICVCAVWAPLRRVNIHRRARNAPPLYQLYYPLA